MKVRQIFVNILHYINSYCCLCTLDQVTEFLFADEGNEDN